MSICVTYTRIIDFTCHWTTLQAILHALVQWAWSKKWAWPKLFAHIVTLTPSLPEAWIHPCFLHFLAKSEKVVKMCVFYLWLPHVYLVKPALYTAQSGWCTRANFDLYDSPSQKPLQPKYQCYTLSKNCKLAKPKSSCTLGIVIFRLYNFYTSLIKNCFIYKSCVPSIPLSSVCVCVLCLCGVCVCIVFVLCVCVCVCVCGVWRKKREGEGENKSGKEKKFEQKGMYIVCDVYLFGYVDLLVSSTRTGDINISNVM